MILMHYAMSGNANECMYKYLHPLTEDRSLLDRIMLSEETQLQVFHIFGFCYSAVNICFCRSSGAAWFDVLSSAVNKSRHQ